MLSLRLGTGFLFMNRLVVLDVEIGGETTHMHLSRSEPVDLPAVSCRVLLKQHFAQYLEEMKGQYIWSVRWYGLIERVQLPKPTRPSLSHLHYTPRSPASTQASARTCWHMRRLELLPSPAVLPDVSTPFRGLVF